MRLICQAAVALFAWLTLPCIFAATATAEEPKRGGTMTMAVDAPRHLNPAVQSGTATGTIGTQIFTGLIELDSNFKPQPLLADKWEVSEDGRTYTFHLNPSATFHDDTPLTSADVAFSLQTVKDNHPFGIAMFAAVDTVETPDEHTAVFKLKWAQPSFLPSLSAVLLPILPKHVYGDGQDIKSHPANIKTVGSGPFKLQEFAVNQYVILVRNDKYFRPGKPYLDRIVAKLIPERELQQRLLAFEKGEIDYMGNSGMNAASIKRMQADPRWVITTKGFEAIGPINYLQFNLRHKPLDDVRVRKAIAYAIDKDFITQKLHQGVSRKLDGPLHSSNPFASNDTVKYPYDLKKSEALLDEAGLKRGADGIRFKMTVDYPTFHPESTRVVAEYLKPQLKKVGIDVEVRPSADFPSWAKRIADWDFDATMDAIYDYPDPIIGVHRLFLCDNIKHIVWTNTSGYCNKRVDELLNHAARSSDFDVRKKDYAEFEKIVTDELPLIYTNEEPYTAIWWKKVHNVHSTVWGPMQNMDSVWIE